jgi:hypothetical protein
MCNQQVRRNPVFIKPRSAVVIMAATIAMMFGLAMPTGAATLDKSWTTGGYAKNAGSQTVRIAALTNPGSLLAERVKQCDPTHRPTGQVLVRTLGSHGSWSDPVAPDHNVRSAAPTWPTISPVPAGRGRTPNAPGARRNTSSYHRQNQGQSPCFYARRNNFKKRGGALADRAPGDRTRGAVSVR